MRASRKTPILLAIVLAAALLISTITGGTADAASDAITWNSTVKGREGAWHRLAELPDGSWLQVVTTFPAAGRSELRIYHSTNDAKTWSAVSSVDDGQRLLDNGFLYAAPDGSVLLAARNIVTGRNAGISQWRSTDQGRTWNRESDIAAIAGDKGLYEPFYYTLSAGRTAVMWSDETVAGYSQVIRQRVSNDSGRTWGVASVVASDGPSGRPGMPSVARMTNGQYLLAYEVCGTRGCDVYSKRSADGVTWPSGVGASIPGHVCGPYVTSTTDGRIFLASCRASDSDLTIPVSYSTDYGVTWRQNTVAVTGTGQYGGWPALYQTRTNTIMLVNDDWVSTGSLIDRR